MTLGVIRGAVPDREQELKNPTFLKHAFNILKAQGGKCQICGFEAGRYTKVIEKNHRYDDLENGEFSTVCPFCFLTQRLELAKGKGRMIYLPELNQVQLNYLVHGCWAIVGRHEQIDVSFGYSVVHHLNFLLERTEPIEHVFDSGLASHPEHFSAMLKELNDDAYEDRHTLLKDVRFLPVREGFSDELGYWTEVLYSKTVHSDISKWRSLGQRVSHRVLETEEQTKN